MVENVSLLVFEKRSLFIKDFLTGKRKKIG